MSRATLLDLAEKAYSANDLFFDENGGVESSRDFLAQQLVAFVPGNILANHGMHGVRNFLKS